MKPPITVLEESDSVAVSTRPFRVLTADGRNMIWDAIDSASLLDELRYKGYGTCVIAPTTYLELDLNNDGYEQPKHNHHLEVAIAS